MGTGVAEGGRGGMALWCGGCRNAALPTSLLLSLPARVHTSRPWLLHPHPSLLAHLPNPTPKGITDADVSACNDLEQMRRCCFQLLKVKAELVSILGSRNSLQATFVEVLPESIARGRAVVGDPRGQDAAVSARVNSGVAGRAACTGVDLIWVYASCAAGQVASISGAGGQHQRCRWQRRRH